jgi:hypothetical protein
MWTAMDFERAVATAFDPSEIEQSLIDPLPAPLL